MATTLFSLLDLLASRFRNENEEGGSGEEGENSSALSIQISESEPHSQPRSRSHTEVSRPPNLPVRPLNRSPIQTRQNRSHTTVVGEGGVPPLPPGAVPNDPNLLNANNPPISRQNRRSTQLRPQTSRDPNQRRSTQLRPHTSRELQQPLAPLTPLTPITTTTATTNTTNTPTTDTQIPTIIEPAQNNNNTELPNIIISTDENVKLENVNINNNNEAIGPTPIPNFNQPSDLVNSSYHTGTILNTPSIIVGESQDKIKNENEMEEFYEEDEGFEEDEYEDGEGDGQTPGGDDIEQPVEAFEEKKEMQEPFSHKKFVIVFGGYFAKIILLTLCISVVSIGYGLFEIYLGCRYIDTPSSTWPTWAIITHSISRTILNTALCMFPYFLLLTFFGFKMTIVPMFIGLASSAGASTWAIYNTVHETLDQTLALLPSYGFFVIALVASSHYIGRKIGNPKFRHLFMGQFVLAAIILIIYDFLLLPWYTTTSSINKSVVRILIHPGLCATGLFIARACSSRIKPMIPGTNVFPVLIFMWFSTYYGRFFNSNMSLLFMSGTMAIVSLTELVWRTTLRPRDKKIMNAICGFCFKKQLTHSQNFDKIYRDFLRHEQLYENTSILTSCFVYVAFYNVFRPDELDYSTLFASLAIQFSLEWITDIISMYIETRIYRIEALHWNNPPKYFYFMLIYTFFLGMSYSTSRIILLGEGKWFNH